MTDETHTYEELEQALADGKTVQVCSVNGEGQVVKWFDVLEIRVVYPENRFRIKETE